MGETSRSSRDVVTRITALLVRGDGVADQHDASFDGLHGRQDARTLHHHGIECKHKLWPRGPMDSSRLCVWRRRCNRGRVGAVFPSTPVSKERRTDAHHIRWQWFLLRTRDVRHRDRKTKRDIIRHTRFRRASMDGSGSCGRRTHPPGGMGSFGE